MGFKTTPRAVSVLLLAAVMGLAGGCAQEVGDIDRTNPNKLEKKHFTDGGKWFYRQTIADVPQGSVAFFTGYSTGGEKLVWEVTESHLIAYRSYELVPGGNPSAQTEDVNDTAYVEGREEGIDPETFKGEPVAAFSISHFDVQRSYSASTGEQSNVISENSSDRDWNEREYMRVNWASNSFPNLYLLDSAVPKLHEYLLGDEFDDEATKPTLKYEYDENGKLNYIEFATKVIVNTSAMRTWYGTPVCFFYAEADCGPVEIEIVHSIAKLDETPDYEMVEYNDFDMAKFGYFRTERLTYDRRRGLRRTGEIFLPNRHNIWESAYDENGDVIPFADRTPKAIAYHLNKEMPEDLLEYNQAMADEWDRAFRRAVGAAQGKNADDVERMFVICQNPVAETDHEACGEPGLEVAVGDVRYNHVYWVDDPQLQGPLGYGPSAADPETGEILSGTAYVYGASVDRYAASAMDIVKLVLACESTVVTDDDGNVVLDRSGNYTETINDPEGCDAAIEELKLGTNISREVFARINSNIDPRLHVGSQKNSAGKKALLPKDRLEVLTPKQRAAYEDVRANPMPYDPGFEARRVEKIKENNYDLMMLNKDDVLRLTGGMYDNINDVPTDMLSDIRPANNAMTASQVLREQEEQTNYYAKNNILHEDFFDDNVVGLAMGLANEAKALNLKDGELDDFLYKRLRGLIYKAVMEHEVGHTIGLRHNFQGSYDALNYFDEYWQLRKETIDNNRASKEALATTSPDTYQLWVDSGRPLFFFWDDLWEIAAQTPNQRAGKVVNGNEFVQLPGGMREYQYSSIMDYGLQFNTDIRGIGRYDEAAIIYAYTTGFDGTFDNGEPVVERGYVEAFTNSAFDGAYEYDLTETCEPDNSDSAAAPCLCRDEDDSPCVNGTAGCECTIVVDSRPLVADRIRNFDDNVSPAYTKLLDYYHYLELAEDFSDVTKIADRELIRYGVIKEQIDKRRAWSDAGLDAFEECVKDNSCLNRPVEVPYMFCTDDGVGFDSSCHRWDHGADPYEQASHVINKYRSYYPFNNFARDSLNFNPGGLVGRTYQRSLYYLNNIYQQLFFGGASDQNFYYRYIAAHMGVNFTTELLLMPNYGDYGPVKEVFKCDENNISEDAIIDEGFTEMVDCSKVDAGDLFTDEITVRNPEASACASDAGTCEQVCDSNGNNCTGQCSTSGEACDSWTEEWAFANVVTHYAKCGWEINCDDLDDTLDIIEGDGRLPYSRYDYERGYQYYYYPTSAGHFYDYLAGILAMTSNQASVRGVDVNTDALAYSLPYSIFFSDSIYPLFDSLWLEETQKFSSMLFTDDGERGKIATRPLVPVAFNYDSNGDVEYRNPETGLRVDPDAGNGAAYGFNADYLDKDADTVRLKPYVSYGNRFYALLYGMAFFDSNLDNQFSDDNKIFRLGAGEQLEAGDNYNVYNCTDPRSGIVYAALDNPNTFDKSAAVQMIQRCNEFQRLVLINRLRDQAAADDYQRELESTIGYMNLMREFYEVFQ